MYKILVVGTSKRKNIELIYSIASKLGDYEFIFVGDFLNYLFLKNVIVNSNISENELIQLYKTSDLLLFPSLAEGFGLPILEAQFLKLPVITSKKEPMMTVAGINGAILVNPVNEEEIINSINKLKEDTSLRNCLIENGSENVKKYHISNIVEKYLKIYEMVSVNNLNLK